FSVTKSFVNSASPSVFALIINNGSSPAITVEVADAQLEPGDTANTYRPTAAMQAFFSNFSDYCVANGIFLSELLDSQQSAASVIERILKITNSEAIWSGNVLKIIPYGDTTAVGNGATDTPNTQRVVSLDDDDYVGDEQEGSHESQDPIQISVPSVLDAFNDVFVEYLDRENAYNPIPVEAKDEGSIQQFGVRPASPESFHEITTQQTAALVAQLLLQRSVYIRRQFQTTIKSLYRFLEPMDVIELTDETLGLDATPVRILSIEEDEKWNLKITAEEFPWGTSQSPIFPKATNAANGTTSAVAPGSVNPRVIFEMNNRITGQQGYTLGIAACGNNADTWGGCHVWLSLDGTNYSMVGTINGPARMGVLTANFPAGSDPDTVNSCDVDLGESFGELETASTFQADQDATLCLVGNSELISYSNVVLVSGNQYTLNTYIRRGQMRTPISAHVANDVFIRLDDQIFQWK